MKITEPLTSRKTALLAKELGFAEACPDRYKITDPEDTAAEVAMYMNWNDHKNGPEYISAPTHGLLKEWLRVNFGKIPGVRKGKKDPEFFVVILNLEPHSIMIEKDLSSPDYNDCMDKAILWAMRVIEVEKVI